MKLSDVLHAFRWLGIEEAEDLDKTPLVEVRFGRDAVVVTTLSVDEEGHRFVKDDEVARNERTYRIENDL